MYLFEVKLERRGKKNHVKKLVEIENCYNLYAAWRIAFEESIKNLADDERITSIELIAW